VNLLQQGNPEVNATCTSQTRAAQGRSLVNVSCGSPTIDRRVLFHVHRGADWIGQIDADMGTGTITSWRVVHVANRDYLEIMVGW